MREVLSGDDSLTRNLDQLYLPEKSYKPERGNKLPEKNQLLSQATEHQENNLQLLSQLTARPEQQYLLTENYLPLFIMQHYDQHYETMQMALQQRALKKDYSSYTVTHKLNATSATGKTIHIDASQQTIGSDESMAYDNEKPRHTVQLKPFSISTHPVSNSQYLAFMQDDGYSNCQYWSAEGWQWLNNNSSINAPAHWRQDTDKNWFEINTSGARDLHADKSLYGINYYEARAYASWCKARLAHEHEWECAQNKQLLSNSSQVWEWCSNRFYPYPGFKAFPYDGYSLPWFEQPHFVLRGASPHTQHSIKRSSFRNFFGPDKRHIFAGCRLAYDE